MNNICIVVPCYNEANRLPANEFSQYIGSNPNVTFCFVNDGSSDNTIEVLNALKSQYVNNVKVYDIDKNSGKAEAVRRGMLHALSLGDFANIGFFDADLATPLSEINYLLGFKNKENEAAIIMGCRLKRLGANIERKLSRHYIGRVFATGASLITQLPVYDSQCGAKFFRTDIVETLFGKKFITKWVFDVEILIRARNHFGKYEIYNQVIEAPLNSWEDVKGSKLSIGQMFGVPIQMLKIHFHYN
ncbi:MAG: glycosyltransferase family 2 protein [Flavobacteriales bacterium]|nr:glycosyltransferase family 2 protein [Flavobacteriales bacterium]